MVVALADDLLAKTRTVLALPLVIMDLSKRRIGLIMGPSPRFYITYIFFSFFVERYYFGLDLALWHADLEATKLSIMISSEATNWFCPASLRKNTALAVWQTGRDLQDSYRGL